MRTALAIVCMLPLAAATWKFAPRAPAVRRDPEATPLPAGDTLCLGPRLATRAPDLVTPGGQRESICGYATVHGTNYAWTRHALFARDDDRWRLVGRSRNALNRVLALPSGALAVVDEQNALLATDARVLARTEQQLLPMTQEGLLRIELARFDARRRGEPLPATPLGCLTSSREASLTLTKRQGCFSPDDFSVRLSLTPTAATVTDFDTSISRPTNFGESLAEFAAVDDALFVDAGDAISNTVRLAWSCDGAEGVLELAGPRASNLHAIARHWVDLAR